MERGCEENRRQLADGFRRCRDAFTAIGDETGQGLLLGLLESDLSGIRVGEIAQKAHLTRPSVSRHLKVLREAGIVAMRREGTKHYYYLSADETRWREIVDLVNRIYLSIQHIGVPSEEEKQ